MPVNQSVATFSDLTFASAFVVYFLALALAIVYYVKHTAAAEATIDATRPALVGTASSASESDAESGSSATPSPAATKKAADLEAKARRFANMAQTMVFLGIVLHATSLVLRGVSASRFPFGNLYEYVSVITFGTMLVTALMVTSRAIPALWPWVLTPVLALMFFGGTKLYAESAPLVPALQSMWYPIHVSTVVTGASICMLSGLGSLVFLFRSRFPKGKEPATFLGRVARPLPAAKVLDQIAYKTAIWALPIFGLGIALGAIWAESAWGRFWGWDPKETMSLVTWLLLAAYLHARAIPSFSRVFAAWINVVCLGTMVFNLFFINMVTSGLHSYAGLN
ncbi:c-type cytochrome biogenesis protein CcsB [Corynebacterium sp. TAE3-ERU30]|uniref:c-type cytochrome biogenesis protein CcsB n=1 Tax=Corynebacterium sp. TAE3-ERU30 TaxID=2849496 RepID=UPI001C46CBAB|nr:c-type cytochrome biogenesis protein CcsB [Corynebacterium sp. TAE3-ERU30]MBV7282513.1 c-type cytochrome biogenesis protein CcsB [Corynebacterium sp. TAE3-ERU30]